MHTIVLLLTMLYVLIAAVGLICVVPTCFARTFHVRGEVVGLLMLLVGVLGGFTVFVCRTA